jgi:hypothetical protein
MVDVASHLRPINRGRLRLQHDPAAELIRAQGTTAQLKPGIRDLQGKSILPGLSRDLPR